uniref:Glutathione S-transferase omega n=2 Tax=Caenorhabditis japonica TaxID=281687 RepID=A0A8R1IBM3_CAEJA
MSLVFKEYSLTQRIAQRMTSTLTGYNTETLKNGDPEPAPPAKGTFRIYNMRFCPWAQRALIYAAAKNIPTEVVNIHLKEKPDWYFSKHYRGQVPALEHDEGKKHIIESAVIPEYLDDIFPENRILPTDPYEKFQQKLLLDRLVAVAPAFYGAVQSAGDPSIRAEKYAALVKAFEEAEKLLEGEFYSGTSKPGYVDYLIYPNIQRSYWLSHLLPEFPLATSGFPGPKFPKLAKWFHTVGNLPEVVAGSQPTETGVGFFVDYVKGNPDYNFGL